MSKALAWVAGLTALVSGGACAQVPDPWPVEDDGVFIPGSMEKVGEGYNFTEGPVWDGTRVISSDISGDTVYAVVPGEGPPTVLYTPSSRANGHTFDRNGAMLNAEHGSGEITRWTPEGGRVTVVAAYQGKHLNSPNDVVVRSDGMIFFTDPPYGLGKREAELAFSGVFALDEASGKMTLIDDQLSRPNGLALSPDEKVLYVGDTATQTLWAYDLAPDGIASVKRLVVDVTDESKPGRVDGVRVDTEGRVYLTCPGGICVGVLHPGRPRDIVVFDPIACDLLSVHRTARLRVLAEQRVDSRLAEAHGFEENLEIVILLVDHDAFRAIEPGSLARHTVYDTRGIW